MKQVQETINKLKKEVYITTSIITIVIILLLLLVLPFFVSVSKNGTIFNGYKSIIFLDDSLDPIYYSSVFLLFHLIFAILILGMSIIYLFIKKEEMKKRFKIEILILYLSLGLLLIASSIFASQTRNWLEIRFGFNVITILDFVFSSSLLYLYLKERHLNKINKENK